MLNIKRTVLAAGGGAIAAAALLGGVAMAQTPSPTPATPGTPTSPAPAAPADPNAPAQSPAPRQRSGADCPEKGAAQGTQGTATTTGPRF